MKYCIFLFLFICSCTRNNTTTKNQSVKIENPQITPERYYDKSFGAYVYNEAYLDERPEYPGGLRALALYFHEKFKYPPEQNDSQTSIKLTLIIDTLGNPKNAAIDNKPILYYTPLDKEALRWAKQMPKWKPGKCNGKKVAVKVTIPLGIEIQNEIY